MLAASAKELGRSAERGSPAIAANRHLHRANTAPPPTAANAWVQATDHAVTRAGAVRTTQPGPTAPTARPAATKIPNPSRRLGCDRQQHRTPRTDQLIPGRATHTMFQERLSGLHAAGASPLANTVALGISQSIAAPALLEKRQHGLQWIARILLELSEPILHRQNTPLPCC